MKIDTKYYTTFPYIIICNMIMNDSRVGSVC